MSPLQPAGSLFSLPLIPYTAMTYLWKCTHVNQPWLSTQREGFLVETKRARGGWLSYRFLAPVLSAQFMTAPTGQASEIRNLAPAAPPRPLLDILAVETSENAATFYQERINF